MSPARRFAFLLLATAGGVACHSQSDPLKGRDGGAGGLTGTAGAGGVGGAGASGTGGTGNIGAGTAFPNGIGTDWQWKKGVVARTAGPYAGCGMIGTGVVTYGAANPT